MTEVVARRTARDWMPAKAIIHHDPLLAVPLAFCNVLGQVDSVLKELDVRSVFFGAWRLHQQQTQIGRKLLFQ
jgi:hypothetical protein